MMGLVLLMLAIGLVAFGAATSWSWFLLIPALLWAPGWGWARWLSRHTTTNRLHLGIDAAWIALACAWLQVAFVREVGLTEDTARYTVLGLSLAVTLSGLWMARGTSAPAPTPRREMLGGAAVLLAVVAVGIWRADDIQRHLHDHWYTEGADQIGDEPRLLVPGVGWTDDGQHWPESGARLLSPMTEGNTAATLVAPEGARGPIVVAVQGPVGTRIQVGDVPAKSVASSMVEKPDEGPVRRYQARGIAAVLVKLNLDPGDALPVRVTGASDATVAVLPSTLAIWELHGEGVLRYTHYYQLLNQVENLDWAEEVLTTRRFTLNQPPGWSPILATAGLFLGNDLVTGNRLFLFVILLVGATAVRLASSLAPSAPLLSFLVPGGMVASHGLLMIEPASTNFPDSLYAAAVLAVALALTSKRTGWLVATGIAAGLLRWPGVVLTTIVVLCWYRTQGGRPWRLLGRLWAVVAIGILLAAIGVWVGELEDLLFILYFETFPEHWHGNYDIAQLASRIPGFYGLWAMYTGGGLILAALGWFGADGQARRGLRFVLGAIVIYSLFLCTIDHHPTHYFLPLVACTGVAVVAASATTTRPALRTAFPTLCLLGLWIFLRNGQV